MTTKPKARKFRIRRTAQGAPSLRDPAGQSDAPEAGTVPPRAEAHARSGGLGHAAGAPGAGASAAADPAAGAEPAAARAGEVNSAQEMRAATTIDEIRQEGLTGRQLRMARRLAQKHGLAPTSDFDAVRLLRQRGIDPFSRGTILELVSNDNGKVENAGHGPVSDEAKVQLPQTMPMSKPNLPSTDLSPAERRAEEIGRIQKDIARRRRRKLALLFSRLAAFVFLPTLLAGYYYYAVATPMYTTKSAFLILSADGGSGGGGLGGLLPSQFATSQDAIATQDYLQSKDAMLRLDEDAGFRDVFSADHVDPIQRLDPDATTESAYSIYKKYVKLGYDPTEGVMRMEVSAPDPNIAAQFSRRLIDYAEERVDHLSAEKRQDALKTAKQSLADAKEERRDAQRRLVALQEGTLLDPTGQIAAIRNLISNVELQLQDKQLALNTMLANTRPNPARMAALRSEITVLEAELAKQNARLNDATDGGDSLASQTAEIKMAEADLLTSDMVLQAALETMRQSDIEANKQVRYLTVSVNPVPSQDPSYPRSFENTILAFLVFSGIYLLISLTASVLREQVSA
ncbi:capsule biosynthesis protein [Roseovarius sp.]|uniref:capsule biosynthesis protein n=1 Tax=Roseovarius sp. TaxID=1486281 RepID=UPI000C543BC7|nr:capsule biosynthesis protein [Roseovarius sp.]MAO25808.1 capsule biosynthesis protein [Roseovarius sp.]MAZ22791.1 capsule biosynthesis protein [Roseovarius sp.]